MSNVFSCTGTIGKDAEVRRLPSGQAVLSVNVANKIGFGDKQKTIWLRVSLWGKRAEGELKNYLRKGQQVFVSGELTMSEYTANDGTKKAQIELNASILDLVGKREESMPINTRPAPVAIHQQPISPLHDDDDCCHFFDYDSSTSTNKALKYPENGAPYDDDIPPF
jgi:single-strand DNA-binding protein